jgi:predicted MPP superfamily phosphohydrolase
MTQDQLTQPNQQDEISLAELWLKAQTMIKFLWKKKVWIIGISFSFAVLGYFIVYISKPTYKASLTFSLEQGGDGGGLSGLASQFGFSMGAGADGLGGDNLLSLMKSRRIVEDVLFSPTPQLSDSIALINHYIRTQPKLAKHWDSLGIYPFLSQSALSRTQDSALGLVVKQVSEEDLTVSKVDKKLSFVTVSYSGHDPIFAQAFVELLSDRATDFYVETKMSNTRENIDKLQRRVDSVSIELNNAMVGYSQTQDQNMFTVQSVAKVPSLQKQIKVTMLTTLYGELIKNLELSKTMAAREEPLITVIDTPHYPLRVRESKLKATLIGGFLGGFLCVAFFGARALIQDLNKQVTALQA